MGREGYLRALAAVARGSAIPYGYTLTVWSSGAMLQHRHGLPTAVEVFLFILGATAGFGVVGLLVAGRREPGDYDERSLVRAGAVNMLGAGVAVLAALLVATIPGGVAWPLGSFVATLVYLGVVAFQVAVAAR